MNFSRIQPMTVVRAYNRLRGGEDLAAVSETEGICMFCIENALIELKKLGFDIQQKPIDFSDIAKKAAEIIKEK